MWIRGIYLRRRDVAAILVAISLIGGTIALAITGHWGPRGLAWLPNFGFASNWHCTYSARGEPICFKDEDEPAKPALH
jgi:hypothetical protein